MIMECRRGEKFHSYLSQTSLEHEKHCLMNGIGGKKQNLITWEFFNLERNSEINKPKEMKDSMFKSQLTQIQMSRTQAYKMHGMVHR